MRDKFGGVEDEVLPDDDDEEDQKGVPWVKKSYLHGTEVDSDVYILLYKEVSIGVKINSVHRKRKLLGIYENIRVLRYPDHFSSGVYLCLTMKNLSSWITKYVLLLYLCFGRYDSGEYRVGDHPSQIWLGKDYYNSRMGSKFNKAIVSENVRK
ncbi:hypothetical protein CASFOL_009185 [Castilleja foliolosa]|uniref:Uncharacterized protein n=1 Tax=Castilleja foliolosa TaxID=1961234 RepID=A0ABD3DAQ2_9LAMI